MTAARPTVLVIAGPNGAGKSTLAPVLLRESLALHDYVNADTIAQGLSAYAPESQAFRAGRIMLKRLRDYADEGRNFAFESTLSSRSYARWLREMTSARYELQIVFVALPCADAAVQRVQARVQAGGHSVPKDTVRRRFWRGINNFRCLYSPIATAWSVLDNSSSATPQLVATGMRDTQLEIHDPTRWQAFEDLSDGEIGKR